MRGGDSRLPAFRLTWSYRLQERALPRCDCTRLPASSARGVLSVRSAVVALECCGSRLLPVKLAQNGRKQASAHVRPPSSAHARVRCRGRATRASTRRRIGARSAARSASASSMAGGWRTPGSRRARSRKRLATVCRLRASRLHARRSEGEGRSPGRLRFLRTKGTKGLGQFQRGRRGDPSLTAGPCSSAKRERAGEGMIHRPAHQR